MRILRRLCIALALTAFVSAPVFADRAQRRDRSDRSSAERRHPRPNDSVGRARPGTDRGDRYREHRQYRPYRPHYRYHRPYRHYYSPRDSYRCSVYIPGYWDYDSYGEYYVRGHYGYVVCR